MRPRTLAAATLLGSVGALLASIGCNASAPSQPTPVMYTLSVTLAQGHELSGPYAATLSGPNGFACVMSQSQNSVTCPAASFPAGTLVPIVVTITVPAFANDVPIWATSGCDSVNSGRNTCTVTMNANRTVTIQAGVT